MSLQFIIGSSGAGKSHKMYTNIIEDAVKNPNQDYILIVPEQFTLQTQRNMVNMHPNNGILNIDVLSFVRLAYKVFNDIGYDPGVVLDDSGKNMILRKLIGTKEDDLVLFKGNIRKQGFISEVKSLISELSQYSISPDDIYSLEHKVEDRALSIKLRDVYVVYSAFKDYLQEKYIIAEEVLDKLYNVLDKSDILRDSVICFDGFTGFTPIQYKLLVKIMKLCKKVYVTVTLDSNEPVDKINEYSLFGMSMQTINKLRGLAVDNDTVIDKDVLIDDSTYQGRFKNAPAIRHIEKNIFRYPNKRYMDKQENISIVALEDNNKEAEYVIRKIREYIRQHNLRYRDIAVITGDIANYGRILEKKLEQNNIPYFIDNNKSIMDNPLVEMIRAIFEIKIRKYSYESVFRYLRCGMVDYEKEELDLIENYVLAYGKNNETHWKNEWKAKDAFYNEDKLEEINNLRKKIYEDISSITKKLKSEMTVRDISVVLYDFLEENNAWDKIENYRKYFDDNNMSTKAKEYEQVYDIVIDLLDKIVDLLGDEKVTLKEYLEIFEAGIEDVTIGVIPMTIDQLVVGDIERTRLNDIKVLFFMGVNENIIPKKKDSGGIISELDRELLEKEGIELSPNKRQALFIEQFYLYMNLTKASEKIILTLSKIDGEGNGIKKAYFVDKLCDIIDDLCIKEEQLLPEIITNQDDIKEDIKDEEYSKILGNDGGLDYLAKGLRCKELDKMPREWKQLLVWYRDNEDDRHVLDKMLSEAYYKNNDKYISKSVANMIYKQADKSVTEIEKYASCAYSHFLRYGLKLRERKTYEIELPDIGTIFHNTLDMFAKELAIMKIDWAQIREKEYENIVNKCVDNVVEDYGGKILYSSKRNEYLINRIKNISKRTVWALKEQLGKGAFVPKGFEVRFRSDNKYDSTNILLEDGTSVGLRGSIDRVDVAVDDSAEYVKVIDYKSSGKDFDPSLFMEGIQLQLLVYMNVAMDIEKDLNSNKEVKPAGVFYYTIDDPFIEKNEKISIELKANSIDEQDNVISEEILNKLIMKGIVNKDPNIIEKIDRDVIDDEKKYIPKSSSSVIKLAVGTNGQPRKGSNILDNKEFDLLMNRTKQIISENVSKMKKGNIDKRPYKLGTNCACTYCEYSSICNFDINLEDNDYNRVKKRTLEDVIGILQSETNEKLESEDEKEVSRTDDYEK